MVKNEARFVWFSVMSVIHHVDSVLLYDTGSTDETVSIIKEILKTREGKKKVVFKSLPAVTSETFKEARQQMLEDTKDGWILMLDGDEVWWEDSINIFKNTIEERGKLLESIVVPTVNLVGDIYHHQDPSSGRYNLAGRTGHLNLRGVSRQIPGLHSQGLHGQWGWVDGENKMIQYRNPAKVIYIEAPYLHATNIPRAGNIVNEADVPKRKIKRKYELGTPFPLDFYYPEVFFRDKPEIVPSPWVKMDNRFKTIAALQTPLRRLKRRIVKKVGY